MFHLKWQYIYSNINIYPVPEPIEMAWVCSTFSALRIECPWNGYIMTKVSLKSLVFPSYFSVSPWVSFKKISTTDLDQSFNKKKLLKITFDRYEMLSNPDIMRFPSKFLEVKEVVFF